MKTIRLCLTAALLLSACAGSKPLHKTYWEDIYNDDIVWTAGAAGVAPIIRGNSTTMRTIREKPTPNTYFELTKLLKDERRFIAAHVILTSLTDHRLHMTERRKEQINVLTGKAETTVIPTYNGLIVDIDSAGRAVISSKQRLELELKWRKATSGLLEKPQSSHF